jgi:hypothetical protein
MDIYGVNIPYKPLTNFELFDFAKKLDINLRGVYMRDGLPEKPLKNECAIVNFNKVSESGTHWVCYKKDGDVKLYFDSYGGRVLQEVRNYLKSPIYRNTDIVQPFDTPICGHLCLYVLKSLSSGMSFRDTLNNLSSKTGAGIKWSSPLADQLHKPVRKTFLKRYVFVRHPGDIFGSDLVDMGKLARKNNGFKYILMVEDVFSKYGWAVGLKSKTGLAVREGLEKIFEKRTPKKLWVDKGSEYYNKNVSDLLEKRGIEIYSTENDEKCSVVERWNRTIKSWIWKYFTANSTHKWVDILDPLIERYNNSKHRAIGMTPAEAIRPKNHDRVFRNLYKAKMAELGKQKPKFKVGDEVRLAVKKDLFEKSYIINWSDRRYKIKEVLATRPITYTVQDEEGNTHKGRFYEQELQKTSDLNDFRVQKILKYKTVKGKRYALVKWMEYDKSTWEPVENL